MMHRPMPLVVLGCDSSCARAALAEIRDAGIDSARSTMASFGPALRATRGPHQPDERALHLLEATVSGAAYRASALAGSPDAGVERRHLASGMDRRALLRPWRRVARTSSVIDSSLCSGPKRCGACIPACPSSALVVNGGDLAVDPSACTACGACSFACPAGAITVPGSPPGAITDQITALVTSDITLIALRCEHDQCDREVDAGEETGLSAAIVDLPCAAMVGPGLLLGLVTAGTAVSVYPCATCPSTRRLAGTVELLSRVTAALGVEYLMDGIGTPQPAGRGPGEVALDLLHRHEGDPKPDRTCSTQRELFSLREPASTIAVLRSLLARLEPGSPAAPTVMPDEAAPLAIVRIDSARCTFCGACALACPTQAISQSDAGGALSVDAAACNACNRCVIACPEEAVSAVRGIDLPMILAGAVTIERTGGSATCPRCGALLDEDPILESVLGRLAASDASPALLETLGHPGTCVAGRSELAHYPGSW